jgi:serine/threonine protein phosphatase 1
MKTFVIGDIHGGYKSLMQCLSLSNFDYQDDRLIHLGDVCDGLPQTKEVINELLKIKYIVNILGNHDYWFINWIKDNEECPTEWVMQGGQATLKSYNHRNPPQTHIDFLNDSTYYFVENNKLFVHGGVTLDVVGRFTIPVEKQEKFDLIWDRELIKSAIKHQYDFDHGFLKNDYRNEVINFPKMTTYDEVFLGHTTTENWDTTKPVHACEVWDLDTGGGYGKGKLTIMDLETKEYFQSQPVYELYPAQGR